MTPEETRFAEGAYARTTTVEVRPDPSGELPDLIVTTTVTIRFAVEKKQPEDDGPAVA